MLISNILNLKTISDNHICDFLNVQILALFVLYLVSLLFFMSLFLSCHPCLPSRIGCICKNQVAFKVTLVALKLKEEKNLCPTKPWQLLWIIVGGLVMLSCLLSQHLLYSWCTTTAWLKNLLKRNENCDFPHKIVIFSIKLLSSSSLFYSPVPFSILYSSYPFFLHFLAIRFSACSNFCWSLLPGNTHTLAHCQFKPNQMGKC